MTVEERADALVERWAVGERARINSPLGLRTLFMEAMLLAVAEEREACARLALEVFEEGSFYENVKDGGVQIAAAIRARGAKP